MKNIEAILQGLGVEIPEDKAEAFKKEFNENYKTINEFAKIKADKEKFEGLHKEAEQTIKGFEGINPEEMKNEIEKWKKKAEDAEADYNKRLDDKETDELLKEAFEGYKFTSSAAKSHYFNKAKEAGLKKVNGKLLGLNDLMDSFMNDDSSAFVSDAEQKKPKFTDRKAPANNGMTKEDIMKIEDREKRQALIAENLELFS